MSVRVDEVPWIAESVPASESLPIPDEEARWIARALAGDESGFRWLLDRYRDRAIRLAAHILRSPLEAEDAAQEAFVKAFRNLRSFRGESRFYTWLYHIVVRVCLDKRKLARWKFEARDESVDSPRVDCISGSIDGRILVESLLDRLSPPMRAALTLRELEGLEYEEIALVLEIPVGTVRSRLNAARSQFRAMWESVEREAQNV